MKKQQQVSEELIQKYRGIVNHLLAIRLRAALIIGLVLHPIAGYLDVITYPAMVPTFHRIRLFNCLLAALLFVLTFSKKIKKHMMWWSDIAMLDFAAGILTMIYLADGASSRYYEGVNLAILGLVTINGFYVWHNALTSLVILGAYAIAALNNPLGWNPQQFFAANFFMGSTALIVVVITKFYSTQHFRAFLGQEELAVLYNQADRLAKIDDLTKVANRRHFFQIVSEKLEACRRENRFFYLVIFDIDHFKQINDTYGHSFGDQVITSIAQAVRNCIRPTDYMGRYGGDEFMIMIDQADKDAFYKRVESVKKAINQVHVFPSHGKLNEKIEISASVGAVKVDPKKHSDIKAIVSLADSALLEVKRTKRGKTLLVE